MLAAIWIEQVQNSYEREELSEPVLEQLDACSAGDIVQVLINGGLSGGDVADTEPSSANMRWQRALARVTELRTSGQWHCRHDQWSEEDLTATSPLFKLTKSRLRAISGGTYPVITGGQSFIRTVQGTRAAHFATSSGGAVVDLTMTSSSSEDEG